MRRLVNSTSVGEVGHRCRFTDIGSAGVTADDLGVARILADA